MRPVDGQRDECAQRVLSDSAIARALDRFASAIATAWPSSAARRMADRPRRGSPPVRMAALATAVAGVVAIALTPLSSTPRPLAWLVPALAAIVATVVFLLAPASDRGRPDMG